MNSTLNKLPKDLVDGFTVRDLSSMAVAQQAIDRWPVLQSKAGVTFEARSASVAVGSDGSAFARRTAVAQRHTVQIKRDVRSAGQNRARGNASEIKTDTELKSVFGRLLSRRAG